MDYVTSDKLLFISASPGAGGYRLGRVACCLDNVYWYEAMLNGRHPSSLYYASDLKGRDISPYHFDRRTKTGMVPLVGERIECYWNPEDLDTFYNQVWPAEMDRADAKGIINNGQYLVWVVHDSPQYLLSRFPNAKIINLVDTNVQDVVDRYLTTTALFPVSIENKNVKPDYYTAHAEHIRTLEIINPHPTYRDLWTWVTHRKPAYESTDDVEYKAYVTGIINNLHNKKFKESSSYINVTWDNLNLEDIRNFLNSTRFDEEVSILLGK